MPGTLLTAAAFVPPKPTLQSLREAAAGCHGCDLYRYATQTVFGEGKAHAPFMLVGEQPGDAEDLAGRPFVGPAGKLLYSALNEAGINVGDAYVTNAVKHFKFVERGKRRIHATPKRFEVKACMPWLEAEIDVVHPKLVVALGATAAKALLGPSFRLTVSRGRAFPSELGPPVIATVHPSSILRAPDSDARQAARAAFVADLREVAAFAG
jgi:uracil-DNA glycosylase family protein